MLRVPITFPPDRFYGAELSAMSVPDLLGTQGTFLLYTTRPAGERFKEGGSASRSRSTATAIDTDDGGPGEHVRRGGRAARTLPFADSIGPASADVDAGGRVELAWMARAAG